MMFLLRSLQKKKNKKKTESRLSTTTRPSVCLSSTKNPATIEDDDEQQEERQEAILHRSGIPLEIHTGNPISVPSLMDDEVQPQVKIIRRSRNLKHRRRKGRSGRGL